MLASAVLLLALQATPAPSPSPTSTSTPASAAPVPGASPVDNPSVAKLARAQFYAFESGKVDESQYSIAIPKDVMPQVQAFLSALGAVKNVALLQTQSLNGSSVYVYRFTCENGSTLEQLSIKDGKINGIFFRPVQ